jgi:hypothetical protein
MPRPDKATPVAVEGAPEWVPDEYRPRQHQELWIRYLIASDGVDADGWWLGYCPLHDERHAPGSATAEFNFGRNYFRCLAEPTCHPGKSCVTLTNLDAALSKQRRLASGIPFRAS